MTLLSFVACELPSPSIKLSLREVSYNNLPGWGQDSLVEVYPALTKTCLEISTLNISMIGDREVGSWQPFYKALTGLKSPTSSEIQEVFQNYLVPYQVQFGSQSKGLFTGYYEPQLRGSRVKTDRYNIAIYARPGDLIMIEDLGAFRNELKGIRIAGYNEKGHLKPYPTRAEIENGVLKGQGIELVWVDDFVDAYFMAIQGSGCILFEDGSKIHLGYAGTNGHAYTSIGKILIERGEFTVKTVTMQSIRAWLSDYPEKAKDLLQQNQSFVFFRELPEGKPVGAQGLTLTPKRSLAVDRTYIPLGLPLWLDIEHPDTTQQKLQQLVIAQDTGGAIKGPIRGDFYWGSGPEAGALAGIMKSQGSYYLFLPRPLS
ncbi:MAG: MltA domain-containing protein [Alphaproteobacteria bacterium]|nr:MltA domain-containing protein [Alphaproteobacteria bacterium]